VCIAVQHIEEVVGSVWKTVLETDAEPVAGPVPVCSDRQLTGRVPISGAWEGSVALICPASLTRAAAGRVFGLPADEVSVEQVRDLQGELTNILAGNLKALLPQVCRLGLPVVSDGPESGVAAVRQAHQSGLSFRWHGQVFTVLVCGSEAGAARGETAAATDANDLGR
jgi:chemotaxis protein CheX